MKFRGTDRERQDIKLNMTAMIDVVFQLLVFFVMTFRVTALEGDFNIKMPMAAETPLEVPDVLATTIQVRLHGGVDNNLAAIDVDDGITTERFTGPAMYQDLNQLVIRALSQERDPTGTAEFEVEFEIDYDLRYEETVRAIEAVSGYVVDGRIVRLVEKIKFRDAARR